VFQVYLVAISATRNAIFQELALQLMRIFLLMDVNKSAIKKEFFVNIDVRHHVIQVKMNAPKKHVKQRSKFTVNVDLDSLLRPVKY
jgi:hypothetical protein